MNQPLTIDSDPGKPVYRGGGEYGKEWWAHGHLEEKQNSFDDFASCMQYLHDNKWTSPPKLTIQVGAHARKNRRPDAKPVL